MFYSSFAAEELIFLGWIPPKLIRWSSYVKIDMNCVSTVVIRRFGKLIRIMSFQSYVILSASNSWFKMTVISHVLTQSFTTSVS